MHVLVYDHSAVILAKFQDRLLKEGYRVTARFPREMNVEQVRKHAPDVLVLGLTKDAVASSIEKLRPVRDDPVTMHVPTIIATEAHQDIELPLDDVGVIHVEFTLQPFECEQVIAAINRLRDEVK